MLFGIQGILFGKTQWLPFSLDIALAILPFFLFGSYLKQMPVTESPLKKALIWGTIWLVTL